MKTKKYNLIQSFGFAFHGLWRVAQKERNFKIHLLITLLIIFVAIFLKFTTFEWLMILLMICLVLSAEIFNSSVESICNLLNEKLRLDYHETRLIRDTTAAAVLLIALFAALTGLIIIFQKI